MLGLKVEEGESAMPLPLTGEIFSQASSSWMVVLSFMKVELRDGGAWYSLVLLLVMGLTFAQSPMMLGGGPVPTGAWPYARCSDLGMEPRESNVSVLCIDCDVPLLATGLLAEAALSGEVGDIAWSGDRICCREAEGRLDSAIAALNACSALKLSPTCAGAVEGPLEAGLR